MNLIYTSILFQNLPRERMAKTTHLHRTSESTLQISINYIEDSAYVEYHVTKPFFEQIVPCLPFRRLATDAPGATIESTISRKMRRFERIHDVVEPVEDYRAGGYHPVHLEDTFQHRYRIVGKWAFGQFSTVWLAEDTRLYSLRLVSYFARDYQTYAFLSSRLKRYVTLKILKADVSSNSHERSILLHLSRADTYHPGKNHVLQLLDQFEHKGPNGVHLCLVFPVMMSDGEAMTVRENPRCSGYVHEISKQILLGLNYLHDQGLIHGGMYIGDEMP